MKSIRLKNAIRWKSLLLAASVICSIIELTQVQSSEKNGFEAQSSIQKIELAKISLGIATDASRISKTNTSKKTYFDTLYKDNLCRAYSSLPANSIEKLLKAGIHQYCNSKEGLLATNQELFAMERELANSLDQWEKKANLMRENQSQATSLALQLNYLATLFLLIFLGLDLLDSHDIQQI